MSIAATKELRDYLQDVRAIQNARTVDAAMTVVRAMEALGRFDAKAENVLKCRSDYQEEGTR